MIGLALALVVPVSASPVVGGSPAPEGRWPDLVALYGPNREQVCTGVLITPDLVLTAGHCGFGIEGAEVGGQPLGEGQRIRVIDTIVHPDAYTTLDAAIMVLDHPATAEPRALARDCVVEDWLIDGAQVIIAGYGATDVWGTEWTEVPYQAETTVVDAGCLDTSVGCNEAVSPGGELIAGGSGIDSCTGDSGGPLYLKTQGQLGEIDWLVAITSRATIPAPTPCGEGGIYVRADALADWIEAETGETLPRPDCAGRNRTPTALAEPLLVEAGRTAATLIEISDVDTDQQHTLQWVTQPEHGHATLDPEGALYYLASSAFLGTDHAVVQITDDGSPPRSVELEIPITIVAGPSSPRRSCETAPPSPSSGMALLLFLSARRKRA